MPDGEMSGGVTSGGVMPDVSLRRANPADAAELAAVHVRAWQECYPGLLPQAYLDSLDAAERLPMWREVLSPAAEPRSGTLVAVAEGIVGFVSWRPSRDDDLDPATIGEVPAIYLLRHVWGRGLGRRLMAGALSSLDEAGFARASLWVLDTNSRAVAFYRRGGWLPDGVAKPYAVGSVELPETRYQRPVP